MDDKQLLRRYVETGAQDAFRAIVARYVRLVYSAALRQVRDHHQAEDVTQAVFLILSQKAKGLSPDVVLAGWLHKTTRYAAANANRLRQIRHRHETRASEMIPQTVETAEVRHAERMSPLLDEAISSLSAADRDAVLLRYFEQRTVPEVSQAIGMSEEATRKRLQRSIAKIRAYFSTRGITAEHTVVESLLLQAMTNDPPAQLVTTITNSLSGQSVSTVQLIAKGATKMMFWHKVKVGAVAAVMIGSVSAGAVYVANETIFVDEAAAKSTEEPAPDSPRLALERLYAALVAGDVEKIKTEMHGNTQLEKDVIAAQADLIAAFGPFRQAVGETFGAESAQAIMAQTVGLPEIPDNAEEKIDGDHATVNLYGMPMDMVKVGGRWKFQYSNLGLTKLPIPQENLVPWQKQMKVVVEETTADIIAGKFQSFGEAMMALQKRLGEVSQKEPASKPAK